MSKLNITLHAALIAISINAFAGNCTALHGQYTIGTSKEADFSSVNAAVVALQNNGVAGPVNFSIEKGIYNGHVVISAVKGASHFNTITFASATSDNADAVISSGDKEATVVLKDASYIAFKNITINHQFAATGNAIRVEGESNYISFKSVAFYGVAGAKTGNRNATLLFTADAAKTGMAIKDCEINNGSIGIVKGGANCRPDSKTSISGTLFYNQYEGAVALSNEDAPFVGNNVIGAAAIAVNYKAISLDNVMNSVVVRSNIINLTAGATGLAMNNCTALAGSMGQISDNSITINGQTDAYGIALSGATNNQAISYNKVNLTINGTHTGMQAYYKNAATGNHIDMTSNFGYGLTNSSTAAIADQHKTVTTVFASAK